MKEVKDDSTEDVIMDLVKGDAFYFHGDPTKETYYYVKQDGMYSSVVEKEIDIKDASKWSFVSCGSIVHKIG